MTDPTMPRQMPPVVERALQDALGWRNRPKPLTSCTRSARWEEESTLRAGSCALGENRDTPAILDRHTVFERIRRGFRESRSDAIGERTRNPSR
jgi:hypothetical protein